MLTFEYNENDATLEVFFDAQGRRQLISVLERIQAPGDHEHLMTPSWSGYELSEKVHSKDNKYLNMVTLGMPHKSGDTNHAAGF